MRCIFCKQDSTSSRSVEHIIPQSLGNTRSTLPPGIVCDRCNNYFAVKLEKPFLESAEIVTLRHHENVASKRRKVPPLDGVLNDAHAVTLHKGPGKTESLEVHTEQGFASLFSTPRSTVHLAAVGNTLHGVAISRVLAKAALEAMAERLLPDMGGISYLVDEENLDPIRRHARYGRGPAWPYYSRRIYSSDKRWYEDLVPEPVQRVWESDFHVIDERRSSDGVSGEWYWVIAIFGIELAINIGQPSVDSYIRWLRENGYESPLYPDRQVPLSDEALD
jgi:hypothetical protein